MAYPSASLIGLPLKLQVNIIHSLPRFPDNMRLRMVNRHFNTLIPPLDTEELFKASGSSFVTARHPPALLSCTSCQTLRPAYNFDETQRKSRAQLRSKRECIDCQITSGVFELGDVMVWQHEARIFCDHCVEFPESDLRKFFGVCKRCWEASGEGSRFYVSRWVLEQLALEESSVRVHHRLECLHCKLSLQVYAPTRATLELR